jgi:hypothetical protein
MNKQELYDAAGRYITRPSVHEVDGAWQIVGKWGVIEPIDDYFDVWVTNTENQVKPLSGLRFNGIMEKLKNLTVRGPFRTSDKEAWCRVSDLSEISMLAPALGIRKRPRISEASLRASSERMKELHK